MKKIFEIYFAAVVISTVLAGCSDVNLLRPGGKNDDSGPGVVTVTNIRNWSGGATISYDLPGDSDLSYVKATFTGTNGEQREARASSYVDSLVIEGFGDTKTYSIDLTAYDKYENPSDPVTVEVNPLEPPISLVYKTLSWSVDFGGFVVNFENVTKTPVGIYIVRRDTLSNEMEYYDVYFTESAGGHYAVRGLPDVNNDFGIYVQDHFGNTSDTLTFNTTPYREDFLDKSLFSWVNPNAVPGDLATSQWNVPPRALWDGVIDNWNYGHTNWPIEFPHRFTVDLGVSVKLSRIKTWQRSGSDVRWQHGAWRLFQIYGCQELPENGSVADPFAGWTLIGDFESVKPSGLPLGQVSDEDIELLNEGEEFSFDRSAPAVRYIRFSINAVHSQMKLSCMSEISLWGEIQE